MLSGRIHNQKAYNKKKTMLEKFQTDNHLSKEEAFACLYKVTNTDKTWFDLSVVTQENIDLCQNSLLAGDMNIPDPDA